MKNLLKKLLEDKNELEFVFELIKFLNTSQLSMIELFENLGIKENEFYNSWGTIKPFNSRIKRINYAFNQNYILKSVSIFTYELNGRTLNLLLEELGEFSLVKQLYHRGEGGYLMNFKKLDLGNINYIELHTMSINSFKEEDNRITVDTTTTEIDEVIIELK